MKIMVVDDERLAVEQMKLWLAAVDGVECVGDASNGREAIARIGRLKPDLVFLDIQMPAGDGISVARTLTRLGGPEVVFVTAFAEFAPEAFVLDAVDYLLKPTRLDRVREALRRARRRLDECGGAPRPAAAPIVARGALQDAIWAPHDGGFTRLRVTDIQWVEAARDYALLHTARRSHILRITMTELEKRFDPAELMRVHRSAFIRPSAVASCELSGRRIRKVRTHDGAEIDVGIAYSRRLADALQLNDDERLARRGRRAS